MMGSASLLCQVKHNLESFIAWRFFVHDRVIAKSSCRPHTPARLSVSVSAHTTRRLNKKCGRRDARCLGDQNYGTGNRGVLNSHRTSCQRKSVAQVKPPQRAVGA